MHYHFPVYKETLNARISITRAMNKISVSPELGIKSGESPMKSQRLSSYSDKDFVIINWRDILNPKAGGAEKYCYEMARRLASDGVRVTWISSGYPGGASHEIHEGIEIVRKGNIFTVYVAMLGKFMKFRKNAYILESVNAIPFLSTS